MPERKGDASEKLENGTGIKHFYAMRRFLTGGLLPQTRSLETKKAPGDYD